MKTKLVGKQEGDSLYLNGVEFTISAIQVSALDARVIAYGPNENISISGEWSELRDLGVKLPEEIES